jgi:hypothetical protein
MRSAPDFVASGSAGRLAAALALAALDGVTPERRACVALRRSGYLHKPARFATIGPGGYQRRFAMSLGVLTFSDPGGVLAITDATTVSRSFDLTTFGLWARVKTLSITLTGLSHTFPDDLDFLFVGPDGTNLAFWSDAGGGTQQPELHH